MDEEALYKVFAAKGKVTSVKVNRDSITRRSLGSAFISFVSHEDAISSLALNHTEVAPGEMKMRVSLSLGRGSRDKAGNVFVKGLDPDLVDNEALHKLFAPHGTIVSARMAGDAAMGSNRGHAYVQYADASSAQAAVEALHGTVLHGRELHVGPFVPAKDRASAADGAFRSVYVKNLGPKVDEGALKAVFLRAGCITSAAVMCDEGGRSRGFGFVNYASAADAARALAELDGHDDAGCVWQVSPAQKKPERGEGNAPGRLGRAGYGLSERSDAARLRRHQANLYVRNLAGMTSEQLRALFQEFGPIESASVLKAPDGTGRGVGFVQFIKPEDAACALAALHHKQVGDRILVVEQARAKGQAPRIYMDAAPSYAAVPPGAYVPAAAVPQGALYQHMPYEAIGGHMGGFPYPYYGAQMAAYGDQRGVYAAGANAGAEAAILSATNGGDDAGSLQPGMSQLAVSSPPQSVSERPEPAAKGINAAAAADGSNHKEHAAPEAAPALSNGGTSNVAAAACSS
ncbi:hypothetical protein WJX81_004684 [Elliptochloris bilobata]|uniref:RRM domain-containing protein n=1 Tax=Elliptochloris bilobata TaxID=381761 RepID=A0AAW1RBZ7_9CHLO